jgi:hypothetical protein
MKTIQYEEFVDTYQPIKNHLVDYAPYEECMYETYGEEVEYVVDIANSDKRQTVWTIINGENEKTWIIPGYHYFDRIGYLITTIPWESEDIQVNDNEMCTVEEAIDYCIAFAKDNFKFILDRYNVNIYFQNNLDSTFNGEMTIGHAKYTAISYYKDVLEKESDNFDDEIHDYYSQLK